MMVVDRQIEERKGCETMWRVNGSLQWERERKRDREMGVENRVKSRCRCCHKVGAALYRQLKAKRRSTFQSFIRTSWISSLHTCYIPLQSPSLIVTSSSVDEMQPMHRRYRVPAADTVVDSTECPRLIQLSFIYSTGSFDQFRLDPSKGIKKRCQSSSLA